MSDNATPTTGRIVWFELPAEDTRRAQAFYSRLFGWRFEDLDGPFEYRMATDAGGAIMPADGALGPVIYFGVTDLDGALARVRELGGVAGKRQEVPNLGSYAHCTDTEGNPFSLWQQSRLAVA
jgi:uncharacterized protein